jgi:hypothetical protein
MRLVLGLVCAWLVGMGRIGMIPALICFNALASAR